MTCRNLGTIIRVKVCGKTIWNYPSERSVSRRGWLHFSIIAKGMKLGSAVQLGRNWNEFYELALFGCFPNADWGQWAGDTGRSRFLLLGFIPRLTFVEAERLTSPPNGPARAGTPIVECKSQICAPIKRNDPVSRRFIQYLMLFTSEVCILVRDAKTGHAVIQPPKEEHWLARTKTAGRPWKVTGGVNEQILERFSDTHAFSDFRFGFDEHYDLLIRDLDPGKHWSRLESRIHGCLIIAHRMTKALDGYLLAAPILQTLHRDHESMHGRDVRPGEMSIPENMRPPGTRVLDRIIDFSDDKQVDARDMTMQEIHEKYYNEIDVAEDEVLFPEGLQGLQIPMFWPNSVGEQSRGHVSFESCRGRAWTWKFYPKEVAGGPWNIQHTLDLKLKRWPSQIGRNVRVRRDIVLVMGDTQEELEQMMLGPSSLYRPRIGNTKWTFGQVSWRLILSSWRIWIRSGWVE